MVPVLTPPNPLSPVTSGKLRPASKSGPRGGIPFTDADIENWSRLPLRGENRAGWPGWRGVDL